MPHSHPAAEGASCITPEHESWLGRVNTPVVTLQGLPVPLSLENHSHECCIFVIDEEISVKAKKESKQKGKDPGGTAVAYASLAGPTCL